MATRTWTGLSSTRFDDSGNWLGTLVPGIADAGTIGAAATVTVNDGAGPVYQVALTDPGGSFTIGGGAGAGSLTVANDIAAGETLSTFAIRGGALSILAGGTLVANSLALLAPGSSVSLNAGTITPVVNNNDASGPRAIDEEFGSFSAVNSSTVSVAEFDVGVAATSLLVVNSTLPEIASFGNGLRIRGGAAELDASQVDIGQVYFGDSATTFVVNGGTLIDHTGSSDNLTPDQPLQLAPDPGFFGGVWLNGGATTVENLAYLQAYFVLVDSAISTVRPASAVTTALFETGSNTNLSAWTAVGQAQGSNAAVTVDHASFTYGQILSVGNSAGVTTGAGARGSFVAQDVAGVGPAAYGDGFRGTIELGVDVRDYGTVLATGVGTSLGGVELDIANAGTGTLTATAGAVVGIGPSYNPGDPAGLLNMGHGGGTAELDFGFGATIDIGDNATLAGASLIRATDTTGLLTLGFYRDIVGDGHTLPAGAKGVWIDNTHTLTTSPFDTAGILSGFGTIDAPVHNDGLLRAVGGTLEITGALSDPAFGGTNLGTVEIDDNSTAKLDAAAAGDTIMFAGVQGEVLALNAPLAVSSPLIQFDAGDKILFSAHAYSAADHIVGYAGGVLTVADAASVTIAALHVNAPAHGAFALVNSGGNLAVVACFARGTRIATPDGTRAVETLREGDLVDTQDGGARPVRWIGRRHVSLRHHPEPECVAPIRIAAGAFGAAPHRDLLLSPDHAVFTHGVLVPARLLVNGTTIRQERPASVQYFHVELDAHGVLFAEGLSVESYLDTGNRAEFANAPGVASLHADFARASGGGVPCARLALDDETVEPIQRALAQIAAGARPRAAAVR